MATIEKITDGRDLIQILEKREYFTRKNVFQLQKLLMDAKVEILAGVVRKYSNENDELGIHLIMAFKKRLKIPKW
jgi:hypothetical protein